MTRRPFWLDQCHFETRAEWEPHTGRFDYGTGP